MGKIHASAIVDRSVILGNGCEIGPYSVVEPGVVLDDHCCLESHVVVKRWSHIGSGVRICSGAVVGGDPQDQSFDSSIASRVEVGADSVLREGVTIHRSTSEGGVTRLGRRVYLMAFSHVAHDCVVGDGAVLANAALLAGHVHVGARAFVGGGAGIHQFCRVGDTVMVGGNAAVTKDIPPGLSVVDRNRVLGLNLLGLKRSGLSVAEIDAYKRMFREFYAEPGPLREKARRRLEDNAAAPEWSRRFFEFFLEGRRGFVFP